MTVLLWQRSSFTDTIFKRKHENKKSIKSQPVSVRLLERKKRLNRVVRAENGVR